MPVRSPLSRVTPALSMATSVPVPMAMPTSAAARAGASLTPSPAMATTRPSARSALDDVALVVGQHLGLDPVDAQAAGDGLGGDLVVAGEHDDLDALRSQRLERGGGGLLDGVGDGEHARDAGRRRRRRRRWRRRRAAGRPRRPARPCPRPWPVRNVSLPTSDPSSVDAADDALADGGVEVVDRRNAQVPARSAAAHDGQAERVLGGAFDAGGQPQDARSVSSPAAATTG